MGQRNLTLPHDEFASGRLRRHRLISRHGGLPGRHRDGRRRLPAAMDRVPARRERRGDDAFVPLSGAPLRGSAAHLRAVALGGRPRHQALGHSAPTAGGSFRSPASRSSSSETPRASSRPSAATCTHLACTVQYRPERSDIWCACHDGVYDANGTNVSGPPPRPLTKIDVNVRGDKIVLRRS